MTVSNREKVKKKFKENKDRFKENWEGYHLLEFAKTIRPNKEDIKERGKLDKLLIKNDIDGFQTLQDLPSNNSAFTVEKSEGVFESLAEFQDIPTLVCFSNFLEFCKNSYPRRPLDAFDGKSKISHTIDEVIIDIKRHVDFWEKSQTPPQPHLTTPEAKQHNDNYYANAVLEVIGRNEQKARLKAFLECDLNVAWLQLAGVAGQGKSRLAFDLMRDASKKWGWRAGFVEEDCIKFFRNHGENWQPDKPHLLIFDYVIGREKEIKHILNTLILKRSNERKYQHKIRILLIERQRWDRGIPVKKQDQNSSDELSISAHISDKASWFLRLCKKGDFEAKSLRPSRFENGVEELGELDENDLLAIVKQLFSGEKLAISNEALKKTLERIDNSGRPLYAYLLAQQLGDSQEDYQGWTKIDLLNYQLMRDKKRRWKKAFKGKGGAPTWGDNHPAMKLAVLATIVCEIKLQDEKIESYFGNIGSSLVKKTVAITSGYLVKKDNFPTKIHALEPDLLGTWFVLYCFYRGLDFKELLNIAWDYSPKKTAVFLLRITQDFIDLPAKYKSWDVTEKLLAQVPPHKDHYQNLANVAVAITYNLYQKKLTIPKNLIAALKYAVNLSNPDAIIFLGFLYHQGIGVTRNPEISADLFRQAVDLGDSRAMTNLGVCYQNGKGVEKDLSKAVRLYRQAVDLGNSQAMFSLGVCYKRGEGVRQNWSEAVRLYRQAVDLGNSSAMVNLGFCYKKGEGVEKDWSKAIRLYWQAVELGDSQAMINLGFCFEKGEGVKQNWSEAARLYQQAVDLGDSQAMNNLGICYQNGKGVDKDLGEAVVLYRQAIDLGNSQAMVNLGFCYHKGEGVEKDWDKAADLYQRAIKAGEKRAINYLHIILLLQNFLSADHGKTWKIKTWPNIKCPCLTEAPVFDPPMMAGNWNSLTIKEVTAYLDKLIIPFEILGLVNNLDGYFSQYGRHLPLYFYKNCNLVDIQFYNPINKNTLIISSIINTKSAILLNGESDIIHGLNPNLLTFDDKKSTLDYLHFFYLNIHGDAGPLQIISNLNEIPFEKGASQDIRDEVKESFFNPRYVDSSLEKKDWQQFQVCILYGDTLYAVTFKVYPDGIISRENEYLILDKLPILQRQYGGVFRTPLRSPNH